MTPAERALREENDLLREQVQWLRDLLAPPGFLPTIFPLTATEERAFKALLSRDQWTKEALLAATYLDSHEDDVPDLKIIDVLICKLRKKLRHLDIEIETFWGKGYRIAPAMRARVANLIAAEHAKDAANTQRILQEKVG